MIQFMRLTAASQDFGLQVHLLCDVEHCSSALKDAADTYGDWKAFLYLHCNAAGQSGILHFLNAHQMRAAYCMRSAAWMANASKTYLQSFLRPSQPRAVLL